jgi:RNA polymerase sigma factor (TIGR02999 family)
MASEITQLLRAWTAGDPVALDRLTPLVHDQLRRLASQQMRKERPGHLLQTTALVNEAYLRLLKIGALEWRDRGHFFAVAARILRRVLVDGARKRLSAKRGGREQAAARATDIDVDQLPSPDTEKPPEICALDAALTSLAQIDPRRAQVVELRFFGGLTVEETADALGISPQSVMRDWRLARAWLTRELGAYSSGPSAPRP